MTKQDFLKALATAYDFGDDFGHNLDAADDLLAERRDTLDVDKLDLEPFFAALLSETDENTRAGVLGLLREHFLVRIG